MRLISIVITMVLAIFILSIACSTSTPPTKLVSEGEVSKSVGQSNLTNITRIDWERTLKEAKREGRILVYGAYGLAEARDRFIHSFNERFGIPVEMTLALGPQLSAKLIAERKAGLYIADIYMGGANIIDDLIPRNILEPIEPYLILPEVKDPSAWFGGVLPFWEGRKAALATLANIPNTKIALNNSILSTSEFTSYRDLLKPKLKGSIIMADPSMGGAGLNWFYIASKLMGEDYVRELVKQDMVLTRDFRLMTEWLIRGKFAMAIGVTTGGIKAAIEDGAPLSFLPPFKEGVDIGIGGGNVAVVDNNPHPNATRVFINWILGKEGQTIWSKSSNMASRRLDVPIDHLEPWQIPDPKRKYIIQDDVYSREQIAKLDAAKEIFAPLLK